MFLPMVLHCMRFKDKRALLKMHINNNIINVLCFDTVCYKDSLSFNLLKKWVHTAQN